jgi:hypothetical protein
MTLYMVGTSNLGSWNGHWKTVVRLLSGQQWWLWDDSFTSTW